MRLVTAIAALGLLALGTAACDRPTMQKASSNGGAASTVSSTPSPSKLAAMPDASSPNVPVTAKMQPGPGGDASGVVSEPREPVDPKAHPGRS